jgi:HD superfamily phosphohydrolase YqeK
VHWHSTARQGLSPLGLVIFLADKLDPQKTRRHPDRQRIKELALRDLGRATLEYLTKELAGYVRSGSLIHPASVEARNELLLRLRARS